MADDNRFDVDELFEPFELDETPPETDEPPLPPAPMLVACPSCGTRNPTHNRHCESCGARIAQAPLPVAPPPMLRTTPGARALGVLAAVILVVALLALIVNLFRDSGSDPVATSEPTGTSSVTTSTVPPLAIEQLTPIGVTASSALPGFPAEALIDTDADNSWNDESLRGVDAQLQFTFAQPMQISQIVIQNIADEERFLRNYRIENLEITIDDLPTPKLVTLDNNNEPQTVEIASVRTTVVTFSVRSTYPAESFNDLPPYRELALQEVKFYGRVSPSAGG